jgi:hypothetical protein
MQKCGKTARRQHHPSQTKARLRAGGHMEPDLKRGETNTEAPTALRMSLHVLLFLAGSLLRATWGQPFPMALNPRVASILN